MVRFGQTTRTRLGYLGSAGFVPRLQKAQATSIAMTTVFPLPVAILQA